MAFTAGLLVGACLQTFPETPSQSVFVDDQADGSFWLIDVNTANDQAGSQTKTATDGSVATVSASGSPDQPGDTGTEAVPEELSYLWDLTNPSVNICADSVVGCNYNMAEPQPT